MSRAIGAGSYRAVLSLPFALRTFVPALGGRLAYGLFPLATLFTVLHATGSYATAGLALGVFGLTSIALPAKARLTDRFGQRRTLPVLALLCAVALTAAVTTHSPTLLVVLFASAGLAAPPLGPAMRATWRVLTRGTAFKERAYALDSVAEETLYLAGPLLTGLIIAVGPARNALLATAFLLLTGTIGMVLPPPATHQLPSPEPPPPAPDPATPRPATGSVPPRSPAADPGTSSSAVDGSVTSLSAPLAGGAVTSLPVPPASGAVTSPSVPLAGGAVASLSVPLADEGGASPPVPAADGAVMPGLAPFVGGAVAPASALSDAGYDPPPASSGSVGPNRGRRGRERGPLRSPGLWPALITLLVAGAGVSVAYTAAAAVAQNHGRPGAAGWLEAAAAVGGVTGGLLWARRRHRHERAVQLSGLLAAQTTAVLLAAAATANLPALALIMALGGTAVSPLYVVAYLAADELAPAGRNTEASTWVNVAANAGSAAGSAAAGLLIQRSGPIPAFVIAGLALAATAAAVGARRWT